MKRNQKFKKDRNKNRKHSFSYFFQEGSKTELDPEKCGFTSEDVSTTVKVLTALCQNHNEGLIAHHKFIDLRSAVK